MLLKKLCKGFYKTSDTLPEGYLRRVSFFCFDAILTADGRSYPESPVNGILKQRNFRRREGEHPKRYRQQK